MAKPQRKPVAPQQPRDLVRRPTAMAAAMLTMFAAQGIDVANAKVPQKREPTWRVSRKG
jgi:hypothetical protein